MAIERGCRQHKFQLSSVHYEITREDHPDFSNIVYQQDGNGNHVRKTQGGVNVYYGIDAHNKLLWVNQGTNAAPTPGQANPYRKYTYNGNGEPTSIEHRDSTGSPVVTETLEWDGMGKLRKVTSGGTVVYTATYNGAGNRVQSTQSGSAHTYSYGAGLLTDSVGAMTYTPGVSHRQAGVDPNTRRPMPKQKNSLPETTWRCIKHKSASNPRQQGSSKGGADADPQAPEGPPRSSHAPIGPRSPAPVAPTHSGITPGPVANGGQARSSPRRASVLWFLCAPEGDTSRPRAQSAHPFPRARKKRELWEKAARPRHAARTSPRSPRWGRGASAALVEVRVCLFRKRSKTLQNVALDRPAPLLRLLL